MTVDIVEQPFSDRQLYSESFPKWGYPDRKMYDGVDSRSLKVEHRTKSSQSFRCLTSDLPRDRKFRRCGIIPYCNINYKNYFIMGVDARWGTLTDFGGRSEQGEDFITSAVRELKEESLDIFSYTDPDEIEHIRESSISVYNDSSIIIFQQVGSRNPEKITDPELYLNRLCREYRRRYDAYHSIKLDPGQKIIIENSEMVWIPEELFYELIGTDITTTPKSRLPLSLKDYLRRWEKSSYVYPGMYHRMYERVRMLLRSFWPNEICVE